ncbi:MAG: hypothetical protein JO345_01775 [Streptosporangiaceae bacterium]|nr:hypothetical protein [Streptosporangiaceae bacterium]
MSAGSVLPDGHANGATAGGPGQFSAVPGWLEDPASDLALAAMTPDRLTVAALCEKFADVCESAVDSLEVASALEFEGYGDRAAREDYGVSDVFALARAMYRRVPRRPRDPEPTPDPWQLDNWRPLLHALLYALPAVCFPAAGALLTGPGVLPALVIALLVAWGLSQGLACIGYLRLGLTDMTRTRRVLRSGLLAGLVLVGLAMVMIRVAVHARVLVLMFGAGEGAYMLGASVLMVIGAERWLPAALTPGVLGSATFLYLGRPPQLEHLAWSALAATPLLACVMAVACTRTTGAGTGLAPTARELRAAVPAVAFGVVAAGLLTFPVLNGPHGHGGVSVGALAASIPLSLSMGAAEWCLLWYRRRTRRLLRTTSDVGVFRLRARFALLLAWSQYVAGTIVLLALGVATAVGAGFVHLERIVVLEAAGYLVLGSAMFLALLLQTMRIRAVPLAASAAALGIEIILRGYGVAIELVVPTGLLLVLGCYSMTVLGEAVRHGY